MNKKELVENWMMEEKIAHIKGWDFSHIHGKYEEGRDFPWSYREIVRKYLRPEFNILDIDTGGGEFLLSLNHPYYKTSATEAYVPNVKLCKEKLLPLGIDFREGDIGGILPFEDDQFDMIINRHGDYNPSEIYRILKPNGVFITQQVGAENDRELVELLFDNVPELPFPEQYLNIAMNKFEGLGFSIINGQEAFGSIKFYDVGALVWFAHIIEWEFPNFRVQDNLEKLLCAQEILDKKGLIEGRTHRFLLIVKKE